MPAILLDQTNASLHTSKAAKRCEEVVKLLEGLGFQVRDGKCPGHKIYTHPGLPDFRSGSFNCEHGKNPQIKLAYISNILRVLSEHDSALRAYLER